MLGDVKDRAADKVQKAVVILKTTMRKRRFLLLIILLVTLLGGYVALWLTAPVRVAAGRYDSIRLGMTKAEVLAIMRLPPRDYSSRQDNLFSIEPGESFDGPITEADYWLIPAGANARYKLRWADDDGALIVYLDAERRVVHKSLWLIPSESDTFFGRLRRWMGL